MRQCRPWGTQLSLPPSEAVAKLWASSVGFEAGIAGGGLCWPNGWVEVVKYDGLGHNTDGKCLLTLVVPLNCHLSRALARRQ